MSRNKDLLLRTFFRHVPRHAVLEGWEFVEKKLYSQNGSGARERAAAATIQPISIQDAFSSAWPRFAPGDDGHRKRGSAKITINFKKFTLAILTVSGVSIGSTAAVTAPASAHVVCDDDGDDCWRTHPNYYDRDYHEWHERREWQERREW